MIVGNGGGMAKLCRHNEISLSIRQGLAEGLGLPLVALQIELLVELETITKAVGAE